jgi:3',5'-cyclic AMP phosphodiesterase CpdA
MPETFTLAHLSDVHLAPLPPLVAWGPRLAALNAKQALGLINWYRARKGHHLRAVLDAIVNDVQAAKPDHIAVTGDLVNLGLAEEQTAALAWLRGLGGPDNVTAIPGNHDVYGRAAGDPGTERWRPYMGGETGATGFPFVKRLGRMALIGVSSAVPTPLFYATGRLGVAQREALGRTLDELGRDGFARVVLIHHPPLPGLADRFRRLEDAVEMAEVLQRHGAELVLHGHNHRPMMNFVQGPAGPIPVVGAPSASASPGHHEPGAGYNLLRLSLEGGGLSVHLTRRAFGLDGRLSTTEQRQLTP